MATATEERPTRSESESVTDLLKELRDETTALFKQEVALAKQEMSEKTAKISRNAGYLIAGGLVAYAGAVVLVAALAALLYVALAASGMDQMRAGWLAPLIMGGGVVAIGAVLIVKALATFKNLTVVPERTVESFRQDKELIKDKVTA